MTCTVLLMASTLKYPPFIANNRIWIVFIFILLVGAGAHLYSLHVINYYYRNTPGKSPKIQKREKEKETPSLLILGSVIIKCKNHLIYFASLIYNIKSICNLVTFNFVKHIQIYI